MVDGVIRLHLNGFFKKYQRFIQLILLKILVPFMEVIMGVL